MSWFRFVEFTCDKCDFERKFMGGGEYPFQLAKEAGWVLGDDADLCSACSKKEDR